MKSGNLHNGGQVGRINRSTNLPGSEANNVDFGDIFYGENIFSCFSLLANIVWDFSTDILFLRTAILSERKM
jgi:hypothetical protein